MIIDKKLNLVLDIERADGSILKVHHVPISRDLYKAHYLFISKALFGLYSEGFTPPQCTRLCHNAMLDLMVRQPDKFKDVDKTLLAEVWRLTNMAVPTDKGWQQIPFYEAMEGNYISEDDAEEVKNYVCFFTSASMVHGRGELEALYEMVMQSGVQTTSLDFTELMHSLRTSTSDANTGASEKPLLVAS